MAIRYFVYFLKLKTYSTYQYKWEMEYIIADVEYSVDLYPGIN